MEGRRDDLRLCDATNSSAASLTDRARELLDAMQPLAELLDEVNADAAGAYQPRSRASGQSRGRVAHPVGDDFAAHA